MSDEQPPLFDPEGSKDAANEGIKRVDRYADPFWKERAFEAGVKICYAQETFTADHMWLLIEKPREPRALGPVMRRLVKAGYCAPTGDFSPSQIPVHHRTPLRIYRSLVHGSGR